MTVTATHSYSIEQERGWYVIRVRTADGKSWKLQDRTCWNIDQLGRWLDELEAGRYLPKAIIDDLNTDLVAIRHEVFEL